MQKERTYQIIIAVLVIIIVILGWWAFGRQAGTAGSMMASSTDMTASSSDQSMTSTNDSSSMDMSGSSQTSGSVTTSSSSTAPTTASAGSDAVSVADQSAGMSVAVSSVTLAQPGWVAVRDSNGRTLGAAWFPAGTETNVSVPLLRATTAGERYQVMLYADNGDKQFDLHTDTLLVGEGGTVAGSMFTAN